MSEDLVLFVLTAWGLFVLVVVFGLMALMFFLGGRDGQRTQSRDRQRIQIREVAIDRYRQIALEAGASVEVLERLDHDLAVADQDIAPVAPVGRHAKGAQDG
ncbi:hypothetical protein ACWFMI_23980 [Nocardiopsis terrae]|uniref:hypothetical protein n=1 Tax=Streptomyces sp. NPDC057554 TaxID=3350538 RepID=UPI0036C9B24F